MVNDHHFYHRMYTHVYQMVNMWVYYFYFLFNSSQELIFDLIFFKLIIKYFPLICVKTHILWDNCHSHEEHDRNYFYKKCSTLAYYFVNILCLFIILTTQCTYRHILINDNLIIIIYSVFSRCRLLLQNLFDITQQSMRNHHFKWRKARYQHSKSFRWMPRLWK